MQETGDFECAFEKGSRPDHSESETVQSDQNLKGEKTNWAAFRRRNWV